MSKQFDSLALYPETLEPGEEKLEKAQNGNKAEAAERSGSCHKCNQGPEFTALMEPLCHVPLSATAPFAVRIL